MTPPYSDRSLGSKIPQDEPAFGVTSQEAGVMAHEANTVDLCIVTSEHIGWLCRRQSSSL